VALDISSVSSLSATPKPLLAPWPYAEMREATRKKDTCITFFISTNDNDLHLDFKLL
jgi:hypothetical protein